MIGMRIGTKMKRDGDRDDGELAEQSCGCPMRKHPEIPEEPDK
jgi:hypothetical protein